MDELNKIQLDNGMLAMLYRNALVSVGGRKVMVVVKSKLTGAQGEFLNQILSACKVLPDQVSVVDTGVVTEKVIGEVAPQFILSFGTGTEIFRMENSVGRKYLNVPALEELMQSSELKRKAWGELKVLFGL